METYPRFDFGAQDVDDEEDDRKPSAK
jgi:hypothetical protein